jgi:glycosyltransferase involved in cell wall biosynthesis
MLQPRENKMKTVLMVTRVFPPFSPVGHSIRAVKFIKYMPKLGWLPMVLTVDDQKEYETMRKVGSETLLSEIEPGVKIFRTPAGEPSCEYLQKEQEYGRKNWLTGVIVKIFGGMRRWAFRNFFLPDRYITWLPYAVRRGRQIVLGEGIDVIFSTCPPHSAILVGAFLKLLTGKPLVLDFRDDWIDTPWYLSKPKMIRKIESMFEKWAVKTADKVILVTEWSREAFQDRYPTQPKDKFALVPNGFDLEDYDMLNSMAHSLHNSKFTIVYTGSLNVSKVWGRSPVGLFQAIQKILQEHPKLGDDLDLIFAGNIPEEFRQLVDEMGLSDVIRVLGNLPHNKVPRLTKSADLLLAINYEGWATLIPGKIYEYWAAGGPPILLLSCVGAAAEFMDHHNLGLTVDPYDVDGIYRAILNMYRQSKTATPWRVSTAGINAYDRQALTTKLVEVLSDVI